MYIMAGGIYKIVLIGDSGVGKSTFANYAAHFYSAQQPVYHNIANLGCSQYMVKAERPLPIVETPTVGVDFYPLYIREPRQLRLHVWDTAGQELYHSLVPYYFRSATVALVFFDVNDDMTFTNIPNCLDELLVNSNGNAVKYILLVGNKARAPATSALLHAAVTKDRIEEMAAQYSAEYIVISVKERPEDAMLVIDKILEKLHILQPLSITPTWPAEKTKTCCSIL